jgi:tRNA modification GTPase
MKFLFSDDPIIACSTCSQANAAMAVIRISGFKSLSQFEAFLPRLKSGPIEPRHVYFTKLVLQGQTFDDLCLTYFEAPHSYNGENILELSIHGNTLNIDRILGLFRSHGGCRTAQPGEFTYRALKNKKLTLSQVEGLDLFLNANSGFALDQGLSLLSGRLQNIYQDLYELFITHKSSLELLIDFSEDVGEAEAWKQFNQSLSNFSDKFAALVKCVQPLDQNLLQPEIVIAGLPNSGKSSFFNFLLSEERAIVSSHAGTTRDYLSESLVIEGVRYKLIDTAGIRDSLDLIESEGIRRAKSKLSQSFFSILLINPFQMSDDFSDLIKTPFDLILFTHSDLPGFQVARSSLVAHYPALGPMGAISLKDTPRDLEKNILNAINKKYLSLISCNPLLLERHKDLILKANEQLLAYTEIATSERDAAILSQELNTLGYCISELIGIISPEQTLNSLFSNFCIGK